MDDLCPECTFGYNGQILNYVRVVTCGDARKIHEKEAQRSGWRYNLIVYVRGNCLSRRLSRSYTWGTAVIISIGSYESVSRRALDSLALYLASPHVEQL